MTPMRATNQIDDANWSDVLDRDNLIRKLVDVVEGEFLTVGRPNSVLILDTCEDVLKEIGEKPET
jgi:hypothetical protein